MSPPNRVAFNSMANGLVLSRPKDICATTIMKNWLASTNKKSSQESSDWTSEEHKIERPAQPERKKDDKQDYKSDNNKMTLGSQCLDESN